MTEKPFAAAALPLASAVRLCLSDRHDFRIEAVPHPFVGPEAQPPNSKSGNAGKGAPYHTGSGKAPPELVR